MSKEPWFEKAFGSPATPSDETIDKTVELLRSILSALCDDPVDAPH